MIHDLANCVERLSNDQQVVALLNSLGGKYGKIRNALEYRTGELTIDIITSALKNRKLKLKSDFKGTKSGKGLNVKQKLNNNKNNNNFNNYNSYKKGEWGKWEEQGQKYERIKVKNLR